MPHFHLHFKVPRLQRNQ